MSLLRDTADTSDGLDKLGLGSSVLATGAERTGRTVKILRALLRTSERIDAEFLGGLGGNLCDEE